MRVTHHTAAHWYNLMYSHSSFVIIIISSSNSNSSPILSRVDLPANRTGLQEDQPG